MKQQLGKRLLLIPLGLLWNVCTLISIRYIQMPDFAKGTLIGVGIGLMLIAFILVLVKLKEK